MTALSTTFFRLYSLYVDGTYLTEPQGGKFAHKGMSFKEMKELQKLTKGY